MSILIAALVLVGVLVVIDLILTLGVVRRLREHSDLIATVIGDATPPETILPAGSRLPAFEAITIDGKPAPNSGPLLIGVFSSSCPTCVVHLPDFVEYAKSFNGRVLGLAVGAPDAVDHIVTDLRTVADVVIESGDGPVGKALQVKGFPSMATVSQDGVVVASGFQVSVLSELQTV